MAFAIRISDIRREQRILLFQFRKLAVVAAAALGVGVVSWLFPNFFVYPYFKWGGWESVWKFWPLFAWGAALSVMLIFLGSTRWPIRIKRDHELFGWELATSTMAGIWEELGYRWAFICLAMIGIGVVNWIFGAGLGWLVAIICLIVSIVLFANRERVLGAVALVGAVIGLLLALYANPIYWFYQFLAWVVHFTTLTFMDPVLYGPHDQLLIFGAILANSWFRDGHKYQGLLGIVNSWYAGMVLLYATVSYGLWTAVVVHALYDILISALRFALRERE